MGPSVGVVPSPSVNARVSVGVWGAPPTFRSLPAFASRVPPPVRTPRVPLTVKSPRPNPDGFAGPPSSLGGHRFEGYGVSPSLHGGFHILMGGGCAPNAKALASHLWAQWLTIGVLSTFLLGALWLSHSSSTVRAGLTHLMGGQTFLLQDQRLIIGVVLIFLGDFLRMSYPSSTVQIHLTHLMGSLPLRLHLWRPLSLRRLLRCVLSCMRTCPVLLPWT